MMRTPRPVIVPVEQTVSVEQAVPVEQAGVGEA
jgi:hypothetical protein